MKLLQLQYFDRVCRCHNVTKAAEQLHVSQPSVSQAIKDLEREFAVNLFARRRGRLELTADGEFFYARAQEILERASLLENEMRDLKGRNNVIDLGISPMIGSMLLPPIYQETTEMIPGARFKITEKNSAPLIQALDDDELDLALFAADGVDAEKFNVLPILNIGLVFCINKLNPLSQLLKVSLADIAAEPLVLMNDDAAETTFIMRHFKEQGLIPNVVVRSDHLHTIDHFINHAVASSLLYKTIIHRASGIVTLPLEKQIMIPIALAWKKGKYLNAASAHFIDFIKTVTFKYVYDNNKPVKEKDNLIPTL